MQIRNVEYCIPKLVEEEEIWDKELKRGLEMEKAFWKPPLVSLMTGFSLNVILHGQLSQASSSFLLQSTSTFCYILYLTFPILLMGQLSSLKSEHVL